MSLALERVLVANTAFPPPATTPETGSGLNISVVFTSVEATLEALKRAGTLASRLGGRITLLVPQVVPYQLPLTSPPILLDWNERRFQVIASESPVHTKVLLYLCRDRLATLSRALAPCSLVVIGVRKRWWLTAETKARPEFAPSRPRSDCHGNGVSTCLIYSTLPSVVDFCLSAGPSQRHATSFRS